MYVFCVYYHGIDFPYGHEVLAMIGLLTFAPLKNYYSISSKSFACFEEKQVSTT